jgi:hypothetical protein
MIVIMHDIMSHPKSIFEKSYSDPGITSEILEEISDKSLTLLYISESRSVGRKSNLINSRSSAAWSEDKTNKTKRSTKSSSKTEP